MNAARQTWAEAAIERSAAEKVTIAGRLIFTGRILVKQAYADLPVENFIDTDGDPVNITQYTAPELRHRVLPLIKLFAATSGRTPAVTGILTMNALATSQPEDVLIFDKMGTKVEP